MRTILREDTPLFGLPRLERRNLCNYLKHLKLGFHNLSDSQLRSRFQWQKYTFIEDSGSFIKCANEISEYMHEMLNYCRRENLPASAEPGESLWAVV